MISQSNAECLTRWFNAHAWNPFPTKSEKRTRWFDDARSKQRMSVGIEVKPPLRLSPSISQYLRRWFDEHMTLENPYPTKEEKEEILGQCEGLTLKQLEKWMRTAREKMRGPPEQRGGKLPESAVEYLTNWFEEHSEYPYPTKEERERILNDTGLTAGQVRKWLERARTKQRNGGKRVVPRCEMERKRRRVDTEEGEQSADVEGQYHANCMPALPPMLGGVAEMYTNETVEQLVAREEADDHVPEEEEEEESSDEDEDAPGQTQNLESWLSEHSSKPYPSPQEKNELMSATGMTEKQLSNWLHHTRKKLGMVALRRSCKMDTTPLQAWLDANESNPFPSKETRLELGEATGMSDKQVYRWFECARATLREANGDPTSLRKRKPYMAQSSIDHLEAWLRDHEAHPYPSPEEKEALMAAIGITHEQLTSWFSRKRRAQREITGEQLLYS